MEARASVRFTVTSPDLADETGVPGGLDPLRQGLHGPVQVLFLPVVAARGPVAHLLQAPGAGDHLKDRLAFAAQGPLVDGMVRIALHIHQFAVLGVGHQAAAHPAKRADGGGDRGLGDLGGLHRSGPPGTRQDDVREAQGSEPAPQTLNEMFFWKCPYATSPLGRGNVRIWRELLIIKIS